MSTIDDEILAALRERREGRMSYVVAKSLRMDHAHHKGRLKTARVLRRLKVLEKAGRVERVPALSYANGIYWRLPPNSVLSGTSAG